MKSHFEILLVEDSTLFANWISSEVAKMRLSCTLTRADSIAAAGSAIKRARVSYDIVILDLNLPDSLGLNSLREILKLGGDTPVIILTSEDSETHAIEAAHLGAQDYLVKSKQAGAELRKAMQFVMARERTMMELKNRIDVLSQVSLLDPLTGVYNRRFLDEQLVVAWKAFQSEQVASGCIMVDLDHFGQVNNSYGHSVGDEVLQWAAATLSSRVRSQDRVCRYGGEEFCILLPSACERDAWRLSERLRAGLADYPFQSSKGSLSITASFGVAGFHDQLNSPEEMLEAADAALYKAKETRNCCVAATESRPLESIL